MQARTGRMSLITLVTLLGIVTFSACATLRSCGPSGEVLTPGMQTQNAILTSIVGSIGTQQAVIPALATAGTPISDEAVQTAVSTSLAADDLYLPTIVYLLTQTPIRFPTATISPSQTFRPATTATRAPTRVPVPTATQPTGSPQPSNTPVGAGPFPTNTPAGSPTVTQEATTAAGAIPSPASPGADSTRTPAG